MPILNVHSDCGTQCISFETGASLRWILQDAGVPLRTGCAGLGACGLCRVRIFEKPEGSSIRLACQVFPDADLTIELLAVPVESDWQVIQKVERPLFRAEQTGGQSGYGLAIDLGTTTIRLAVIDRSTGAFLAGRRGLNPQIPYGTDVMARLLSASQNKTHADDLQNVLIASIAVALREMANDQRVRLNRINQVTIVGNTAMLALLSGKNHALLLKPEYWGKSFDCLPESDQFQHWLTLWGLTDQACLVMLPPLGGFVGSDLLAGLLLTEGGDDRLPHLFIDYGTNTEIALWDGAHLSVTSAAGGPAFEGCGITCGMPAETGAIYRVRTLGGKLDFETFDHAPAKGICGSGLIDLVAGLQRIGRLDAMGRFRDCAADNGIRMMSGEKEMVLYKRDVDAIQRAKSAVATGIQILMSAVGVEAGQIRHLSIAGSFGRQLDLANAMQIGLIPQLPLSQVTLWGDSALAGCVDVMVSEHGRTRLGLIAQRAKLINLAACETFDERFVQNLYLQPWL